MTTAAVSRSTIIGHIRSAVGAAIVIAAASMLVAFDRRPPVEYVSVDITPAPAVEGGRVTVHRHVVWHRRCDAEVYREVVLPTGQIAGYSRRYRPYPSYIGENTASSTFTLPSAMLGKDQPRGTAKLRGRLRFPDCGITSRLWPIEIPFMEAEFEVVRGR